MRELAVGRQKVNSKTTQLCLAPQCKHRVRERISVLLDHTGRNHQACNVDWIWGREAKPGRKKFFVEFSKEMGRVQPVTTQEAMVGN